MSKQTITIEELKAATADMVDQNPQSENENPPETPETPNVPVVKKTALEKFCDARYEKRVKRAEEKATKAQEPKEKKKFKVNWKLVGAVAGGLAALGIGAVTAVNGMQTEDGNYCPDDDVEVEGDISSEETTESEEPNSETVEG